MHSLTSLSPIFNPMQSQLHRGWTTDHVLIYRSINKAPRCLGQQTQQNPRWPRGKSMHDMACFSPIQKLEIGVTGVRHRWSNSGVKSSSSDTAEKSTRQQTCEHRDHLANYGKQLNIKCSMPELYRQIWKHKKLKSCVRQHPKFLNLSITRSS